jgi:hypothetical protein
MALRLGIRVDEGLIQEDPISRIFRGIYVTVGVDFAEFIHRQVVQLKAPDPQRLNFFERAMERFAINMAADRIRAITNTSKAFVRSVLSQAARDGWGPSKISVALRQGWNALTRRRSILIARTEMITASGHAALVGARYAQQATGIRLRKEWMARLDGRERDSHRAAHRQRVGMDEAFTVGGHSMEAPGDSSHGAPAEEICNCRCTVVFRRIKD